MDLQGPVDDFKARTAQLRLAVHLVEVATKSNAGLVATRPKVDFADLGGTTGNTVNSMSIVFLASSYEEFVREEIGQCADYLQAKYKGLNASRQLNLRASYWLVWLERARRAKPVATKSAGKYVANSSAVAALKRMTRSASGFVVDSDASAIERENFYHHSNNFRPWVVDELGRRLGFDQLTDELGDHHRIKNHFGVSKKSDAARLLREKLDQFYERRNELVHSLSAASGYAPDVVLDYMDLLEAVADSLLATLTKLTKQW